MRPLFLLTSSVLAFALGLSACTPPGEGDKGLDNNAAPAADGDAVYNTYGVHNPPDPATCGTPDCSYAGAPGRPPDPIYPPYWQSRWTMYRVFANYANALPPYKGPPPGLKEGQDYEVSYGASYYDSTWVVPGRGNGAMMEYYDKRCLPIFPGIANTFTCAFISLGDTAFFLTYPQDRPTGMPPVCLFSPLNHPPRRDFVTHLPYSPEDSGQLGPAAQAYSFWIGGDGKPYQTGVSPDQTPHGILFGYAFAPVNGRLQPQSFYFSGIPPQAGPVPNAPFVSQNYTNWAATRPDPAKTWDLVSKIDPKSIPACTVMGSPSTTALTAPRKYLTWFDIGRARSSK
jgi:hypothetical protein